MVDLYIQFVLKQGQIESRTQPADLSPSQHRNTSVELIHRHEVETLNQAIIVNLRRFRFVSIRLTFSFSKGIGESQNSSNGKM